MSYTTDVSIVIPLFNEEESLPELATQIHEAMTAAGLSYEVLMIDDGSSDASWAKVQEIHASNPSFKGVRFQRNYGKSAALNVGFERAVGEVVVTMDADLQDDPAEVPEMVRMIREDGHDLVSGWKRKRHDPIGKTLPSKLFNGVTARMSGIKLHDFNCGLKAYKNGVVKSVEVYGEMHRYIPVMAKRAGFPKITEKVVQHRARKYGKTKFGMERFVNGFLDLLSIQFVTRFSRKPMHFFGLLGTLMFVVGFAILCYLMILKLGFGEGRMTDRPIFYLGLLTVIMGSQLFLTGFIAELVSRNNPSRNDYNIREELGGD